MKSLFVIVGSLIFAFVGQSCFNTCLQDNYIIAIRKLNCRNVFYHIEDEREYMEFPFETNTITIDSGLMYAIQLNFIDSVLRIVDAYNDYGFGQMACATGESYDGAELNSEISNVTIKTVHDFDSTHLGTSDVSEYFTIRGEPLATSIALLNLNLNNTTYYPPLRYSPVMILNTGPTISETTAFIVDISFLDGSSVSGRTEDVIIK